MCHQKNITPVSGFLAFGVLLMSQGIQAQTLKLPEIILPTGLRPYVEEATTLAAGRSALKLLKDAKISRHTTGLWSDGLYTDSQYPKQLWDQQALKSLIQRSPCENDVEAMAIHRGWAW